MNPRSLSPREYNALRLFMAKVDQLAIKDELQPELRTMIDDMPPTVMLWGRDAEALL